MIKLLLLIPIAILSIGILILAIRQIEIPKEKATVFYKLKKSIIFGFCINLIILLFFLGIQILLQNWRVNTIDLSAILFFSVCFLAPAQIIATIGGFIQITYLDFLTTQTKGD